MDGSPDSIYAMVEQIWTKYDMNGDGKLTLNEAKPFLRNYCKDELEMDDAKEAFLEETWKELDEDMKGYATKDDMNNFLLAAWELKN